MTQDQIVLDRRAAQVEITVFQPSVFQRVSFFGNDHRGGFRRVDDVHVFSVDFDLPGRHLRIFILAFDNLALDLQDIFVADVLDLFSQFFIHSNLNDAAAVAQVDKDQRAQIAPAGNPADDRNVFSGVG